MNMIIDTSTKNMLAILQTEKDFIVAPKTEKKHQENLLPSIEKLLLEYKTTLQKVDNIGVVVGPGSFTGIRLAVATAKAFCYVDRHKKIVAINMLDLLGTVAMKHSKGKFCVCVKCTSSKMYVGQFDKNGEKVSQFTLLKEDIKKIDDFEKFFFFDEDFFSFDNFKQLKITEQDYVDYMSEKVRMKEFVENEKLEPFYMALSQAEEELLKKEKKDDKK